MRKIYCRKCGKRILTDRQPYRGIGKPKYINGDYIYKQYEHADCNFKSKKLKVFTTKKFKALCKELNDIIKKEEDLK